MVAVTNVRATGLPNRQLQIGFKFSNPLETAIAILNAWISVSTNDGMEIALGRQLRTHGSQVGSREESYAELIIPISTLILQHIEERRTG